MEWPFPNSYSSSCLQPLAPPPFGTGGPERPKYVLGETEKETRKKPLINKKLDGEFLYQHYFAESYILSSN